MNVRRTVALAAILAFAAATPAMAATPASKTAAATPPATCDVYTDGDSWMCSEGGTLTQGSMPVGKAAAGKSIDRLSFSAGTVFDKWTWKYNDIVWYGLGTNPVTGTTIGKVRMVASLSLNGRRR